MKPLNFSSQVKNELSKIVIEEKKDKEKEKSIVISELAAFTRMCGTLKLVGGEWILSFVTENASIARRIFSFIKRYYMDDVDVLVLKNRQLKKNSNYVITARDPLQVKKLLKDIAFVKNDNFFSPRYEVDEKLFFDDECKRSYIRASFLGGGSISNPEKSYHLEFVTGNEAHAENLCKIINSYGITAKLVSRKESYIVYLKDSELISNILVLMGANNIIFDFENIRVKKDIRNNVNRVVNCETANLSKTVDAAMKQIEDIEFIKSRTGFASLEDELKQLCELRLEYTDASLKELGEMCEPKVGKSGVNHRFKKIASIADKLRGGL